MSSCKAKAPTPVELDTWLGSSLMYKEKRKEPNNKPCGTPMWQTTKYLKPREDRTRETKYMKFV